MKKTWVKRENMYFKPFYKQKRKMFLLGIFVLGIVFFAYQAFSIKQLPNSSTPWSLEGTMQGLRKKHKQMVMSLGRKDNELDTGNNYENAAAPSSSLLKGHDDIEILKGIRLYDYDSYKPNFDGQFKCLDGSQSIPFDHVNDDYCDCVSDGSDEPSTNACPNGRFYCQYQKRHITGVGLDVSIPSSRVNDGICDCCDGSDEWHNKNCPNVCT